MMMKNKKMILLGKAVGWVAMAAIVDIVFQYFSKQEYSFQRTVGFALVFGLGNFIYDWKKKKK